MKGDGHFDMDLNHGLAGELAVEGIMGGCEVKRDRIAHRTGNLFVEHACNGKPSGLAITRADWWAFVVDDASGKVAVVVMVPVWRLREMSLGRPFAVRGGDGGRAHGVLVPIALFVSVGWGVLPPNSRG